MSDSLFDRIGGKPAVEAAVDKFYEKVIADQSISHFFDQANMKAQINKQKAFLTLAFGGPTGYDGKDLRSGHAHLVSRGLNEDHFNSVAVHLQTTLEELGVPSPLVGEVMAIAGSTKNDVLGL
jgi:hemoglobin